MSKVRAWSNNIKKGINSQRDNIFKRDFKFFKIDRLERISERIDDFSDKCDKCEKYKIEIESIVSDLSDAINGSPGERSRYEKRNEVIVKHLKQDHDMIHRDYYSSVYSFAGLTFGLVLFGAVTFLINIEYFTFGLLLGFTVGIIAGRILGRKKDREKESKGLIL